MFVSCLYLKKTQPSKALDYLSMGATFAKLVSQFIDTRGYLTLPAKRTK